MQDIKITYSEDLNGNLVHIDSAIKGSRYICPTCRKIMSVRISRLQIGEKYFRRPHYAHQKNSNCSPETVLHNLFKTKVAEYIQTKIDNKNNINFSWDCEYCKDTHSGNLIKKINSVKLEYYLGECTPDIALFDKDNNIIAVIEVVVTHKPEEKTLLYYKEHNIILIQIDLASFDDIDNLEVRLLKPNIVTLCVNPKCTKCGCPKLKLELNIISANCYRCHKEMKVASIYNSRYEIGHVYPESFLPSELELARQSGVIIKQSYSKTKHKSYNANVCPHCNAFIGSYFLFEDYIVPSVYGDYDHVTLNAGYTCLCDRDFT